MGFSIYKITNKINGKCYIGQTRKSVQGRWNSHCCSKTNNKSLIKDAIHKYGKENFTFEVIAEASSLEELNQMEKFNIAANRSLVPEGYNIASGGDSKVTSEATKQKISESKKGTVPSNKGKTMSQEQKDKISAAKVGKAKTNSGSFTKGSKGNPRPHSTETKLKISNSLKVRNKNDD